LVRSETHRQATRHDCLPSLLGDGDKGIEIVYGEGKNKFYWADKSSPGRTKSLVLAPQAQAGNQGRTPFYLYSWAVRDHRDTYLEQQETEKIDTEVRDVDRRRITKVYACRPGWPFQGS
jgi:hypothetical protein